ncbi:hypothetical protein NFI96_014193, partial [Prochilodus magdalenae]
CALDIREQLLDITAHTGGSVLLPCYCTDLQTKPEKFSWRKYDTNTKTQEEISSESGQYRNRVQLVNDHSPGNLSLLISHLTEEDGGEYWCAVKGSHIIFRLTFQEPPQSLPFVPFALVTVIFLHIIVAVVYYTSRTKGCTLENREQLLDITAHTGGSVLLPCYCTDLQTTPEKLRWKKENRNTQTWEEISSESGCTLENREQLLTITAHTGGSVLLPCYCTDLQTKPEKLKWKRPVEKKWVEIQIKSDQYRNRVQLVNDHSPGNLSLLISHLTEEDGGDYLCAVKGSHINIRLTLKGCTLENSERLLTITAPTGGSVLLPCYCTDLQTKPEDFTWKKRNRNT